MIETVVYTIVGIVALMSLVNVPSALKCVGLYGRRDRFKCQMCGNCCRLRIVPLTDEDIKRLQAAGHKDFTDLAGEPHLRRVQGRCVFLKDDKCSVHECRPDVCRDFPFFKFHGIGYARQVSFCPALEELRHAGPD
jgi:uncharacterized protein